MTTQATAGPSPLVAQIEASILQHIASEENPQGTQLVERKLAELLRVSRSPVRTALQQLEGKGFVERSPRGGYVVARAPELPEPAVQRAVDDEHYLKIASDRLEGKLADRVTENHLMRRYGISKAELTEILRRISNEGWIDRLPGYGWEFLPMLDSMKNYADSYRFRLLIEPAAILEPGFEPDVPALERCRDDQQQLIDGGIWTISNSALFDSNSALHEAIMACSNNMFFIDSLRRIDRLRRLIEYKKSLPRDRAIERCREHVHMVDLILAGKRDEASDFMRQHLSSVSGEKTTDSDDS